MRESAAARRPELTAADRRRASPPAGRESIRAILLAAGGARRFGTQKLLQPLGGVPIVRRAAERLLAGGAPALTVVLGREAAAVRAVLRDLPAAFVVNRRYVAGLAGSIRAGIRALPPDAAGALVALGDQPDVSPEVVSALLAAFRGGHGPIVAPAYRRSRGNPVLFDRSLFPELLRLRGDVGARTLLAADPGRVYLVHFDLTPPGDVDTPADYRRALGAGSALS